MIDTMEEAVVIVRSLVATKELLTAMLSEPDKAGVDDNTLVIIKRDIETIDGLLEKIMKEPADDAE